MLRNFTLFPHHLNIYFNNLSVNLETRRRTKFAQGYDGRAEVFEPEEESRCVGSKFHANLLALNVFASLFCKQVFLYDVCFLVSKMFLLQQIQTHLYITVYL